MCDIFISFLFHILNTYAANIGPYFQIFDEAETLFEFVDVRDLFVFENRLFKDFSQSQMMYYVRERTAVKTPFPT